MRRVKPRFSALYQSFMVNIQVVLFLLPETVLSAGTYLAYQVSLSTNIRVQKVICAKLCLARMARV